MMKKGLNGFLNLVLCTILLMGTMSIMGYAKEINLGNIKTETVKLVELPKDTLKVEAVPIDKVSDVTNGASQPYVTSSTGLKTRKLTIYPIAVDESGVKGYLTNQKIVQTGRANDSIIIAGYYAYDMLQLQNYLEANNLTLIGWYSELEGYINVSGSYDKLNNMEYTLNGGPKKYRDLEYAAGTTIKLNYEMDLPTDPSVKNYEGKVEGKVKFSTYSGSTSAIFRATSRFIY